MKRQGAELGDLSSRFFVHLKVKDIIQTGSLALVLGISAACGRGGRKIEYTKQVALGQAQTNHNESSALGGPNHQSICGFTQQQHHSVNLVCNTIGSNCSESFGH